MTALIDPVGEARRRLHDGGEIALLDIREAGQFGEAHPLFATPCPYSRLELLAPRLVPRRTAREARRWPVRMPWKALQPRVSRGSR